ncbi:MAG: anti-sigma factor [Rhodothermaceae bacterium]
MADKQTHEMISAYAAGCLDVDNFINFKEFLTGDGDLPHSELGELQNVMALLSISQDLEQPPAALKTGVAKKLISLKGEIKAKIKAERDTIDRDFTDMKKTVYARPETKFEPPAEPEEKTEVPPVEEKPIKEKAEKKPEKTEPQTQSKQEKSKPRDEKRKAAYYTEDVETKSKTAARSRFGFFASIAALILISFSVYYSYSTFADTKKEISDINLLLKETQAEAAEAKNFMDEQKKLLNFFSYNDVAVVNFENSDPFGNYSGKLFISFDKTLGLLMINNLPELVPGEMYQLWLVSRGRSYPVISFIPQKHTNYINISELPAISKAEIDMFKITTEKKPNPDMPEGKTILSGGFSK